MASIDTPLSLLDRLVNHDDDEAWRRFAGIYEPLIRRWVIRCGSQSADVDNIVQDVLSALIEGLPAFQHNARVGAFARGSGPSRSIGFAATGGRRV